MELEKKFNPFSLYKKKALLTGDFVSMFAFNSDEIFSTLSL